MEMEFQIPTRFPLTLVVAIPSDHWDPAAHHGAWLSTTAEEYRRAYEA